ncbi:uncharacterized protein VNE69_02126 [Vairimorpha necatrix]|uniref:Uncharacterized protein n=1 Tax=Vairimorpha necatrix TaxID=6039 RepID=A0AAX4J9Q5_9MICR
MDRLYGETTDLLLDKLAKFKENKASYEELKELFDKEEILSEYKNWENIERKLRKEIFEKLNKLNTHLLKLEKKILTYKNMNKNQEIEINMEDIKINSNILCRNKEPLEGYSNSPWYLPCYPTLNMIEFLHENEDE